MSRFLGRSALVPAGSRGMGTREMAAATRSNPSPARSGPRLYCEGSNSSAKKNRAEDLHRNPIAELSAQSRLNLNLQTPCNDCPNLTREAPHRKSCRIHPGNTVEPMRKEKIMKSPALLVWLLCSVSVASLASATEPGPKANKTLSEKDLSQEGAVVRKVVAQTLDNARLAYQGFGLADSSLPSAIAEYQSALESAIEQLGDQPLARRLKRSLQSTRPSEGLQFERMRLEAILARAADDLRFQWVKEAELPEGWPEPTPVGAIRVKQYPAYRLARADMSRSPFAENTAFFTLFNHIKKNDIPMTAPVEMTVGDPREKARGNQTMGFLYQSPRVGEAGAEGSVEVADVAPMLVVAIGLRGWESQTRVESARRELLGWIERNGYRVSGELRSMGYNSPGVRGDRRYFEVEVPVRRAPRRVAL